MARMKGAMVAVVALLAAAGVQAADHDREKIQGTWITTEVISKGKKEDSKLRMELKEGKVTVTVDGAPAMTGTYTIRAEKQPAEMDITYKAEGKKLTVPAIYELKGDTLKLCHPFAEGGSRPTSFKATRQTVVVNLKRQNP